MDDIYMQPKPGKLIPVLIGGAAMTATTVVPVLNMINCICCAGIMGGAVLATFMFKKNFPDDMPFTVGDGAVIGVLSGLVGAVLNALITVLMLGASSAGMSVEFDQKFDEIIRQLEAQGQDPHVVSQIRDFFVQVADSALLLFFLILAASIFIFAVFGVLGGLIGGSIFRTRVIPTVPPSQQSSLPS